MNGNANPTSTVVVSSANNAVVTANRRKIGSGGRPMSTRGLRTKGAMDRSIAADGIYSNTRFMNAAASIVGCVIRVHTVEGSVYEGIFRTFSPQFEFVMEMGHKVDTSVSHKPGQLSISNKDEIVPTLIFRTCDVTQLTSLNTDLEYATKDKFATDAIISKFNGQVIEKKLEPWDGIGTETESVGHGLEMDNANGWDVNDMFRTNEQQYGVQSSYDSTLSGYTTQLEKKNTDEYKKQEAKALKLASEIESSSIHRARSALENVDEDEKISAVVRPGENNYGGKCIPPPKRKNQQTGKLPRGGSNSASQGSYGMPSSGRMGSSGLPHLSHSQLHGGGGGGGGGSGSNYARLPHSNASNNTSGLPQQQHHSVNSQSSGVSHYQQHVHRQQNSPPGLGNNLGPPIPTTNAGSGGSGGGGGTGAGNDMRKTSPHHLHPQQQQQQQPPIQVADGDIRLNCESRVEKLDVENNKPKQQQQQPPPPPQQHGSSASESVRREAVTVNEARNDSSEHCSVSASGVTNQHQQPPNSIPMQLAPNHISQKLSRKNSNSKVNRDDETAALKNFGSNFKLPSNEDKEESNNVSSSAVDDNEIKEKIDSELDKTKSGVKKSTLNPCAEIFTPRTQNAQTPTPPRAHTPGGPMTQQAAMSLVSGQHFPTMAPYLMLPSQLATVGQSAANTLAMHQGGGIRLRRSDSEHPPPVSSDGRRYAVAESPMFSFAAATSQARNDFSHVAAAATGQPLLAPTSQALYVQYPQQTVGHGGPQHNMPYGPQIYSSAPRLMSAQAIPMMPASHLVQHTDPQHMPSQMFISTHPGVPPHFTQGPTPQHANHTPIPNINQGVPHSGSTQGQPLQQSQVTSMHANPSPVHGGGNTPTQQNPSNQPQATPNAQQLSAYSNPHAQNMTTAQLQGGPHTPNSPQSMHPGQVNNSNPTHYLQAASLVAHAAASNVSSPHANQAHPHPSQGGFPGTPMVIINQPGGPGTPTSITGHPTAMHTLQGPALGHGLAQLVHHTSMVPVTSAGNHQIFMTQHGARPNTVHSRILCAVPTQSYQL